MRRDILFEHEVYALLSAYGRATPKHLFIPCDEWDTKSGVPGDFPGDRVVVKIVAEHVAHKQKAGGVAIVESDRLAAEVDSMFERFAAVDFGTRGVLITEFVPYSDRLGDEVLVGMRRSREFGPVLSISKGGDDAELFAAEFAPAEIFLLPSRETRVRDRLEASPLGRLLRHRGAEARLDDLARLATLFGNIAADHPELTDFEINPFVWDREGRFLPLDGLAFTAAAGEAGKAQKKAAVAREMQEERTGMQPFLEPRGIAVVGVSASNAGKSGNIILANLLAANRSDVWAVNAKGGETTVDGVKVTLHRSLSDLPEVPELVVITVPAAATSAVVEEAAAVGAKALLLIPGGFSELTGDDSVEQRILEIARDSGMRLVGPNCLGIIHAPSGVNTFFIPEAKFPRTHAPCSNAAFVSQSGALALVVMSNLRNSLSPRTVISYGNEIDLPPSEMVAHVVGDEAIDVVAVYVEGFSDGDGRALVEVASESRVPVIVYKAGRTSAGMLATASHTASISGDYTIARAAFREANIIEAETIDDLVGLMKCFSLLAASRVTGRNVVVISNAGYEKTNAADNFDELELATFDDETASRLRAILPPFVGVDPLLDLTPMANNDVYAQSLRLCLESAAVDAVVLSVVPHSPAIGSADADSSLADALASVYRGFHKPVVAAVTVEGGSDYIYNRMREELEREGIPTTIYAEDAARLLDRFISYRLRRR